MDVKPGYKQTEVGIIPEDWEIKPLHTLADKIMVGIASAATHAYRKRGVVMFRNQNIKPGYLDDMDVLYIDEVYEETFRNKRLKAGDLLTARTGYPGTTSIVPAQYEGAQSFTTLITRPRQSFVDSEYLCFFINSEAGQTYFDQNQIGGGQKNVNAGSFKHLAIPLPPTKAEQKAIAAALSDADAFIESLEQLLTKKRQIKKGAMQELLTGNKRLPGFRGKWETKRLGEISAIAIGHTPSRAKTEFWGRGHVWLSIADLSGKIVQESKETITNLAAAGMSCVSRGTLLMSFKLSIGKLCFAGCDLFTNEAICSFTNVKANADYLYYALSTTDFSLYGKQAVKGYTLNSESLKVIDVFLPKPPEQTAIAIILSDMDKEIAALESKLAKARRIKQGMMQELLTGRIRLI